MRNPNSNYAYYTAGNEPALFLGRGYTGHEHLPMFGLINMNARLYDPVIGRFLSPDPYVQAPYFSQNFNRYSYAWNNPLRYTDPNGEFIHIIVGAVVGGAINWVANGCRFDSSGLLAFGIGAGAGALTAATGGLALAAMGGTGFAAGAVSAGIGYVYGSSFLNAGNNAAFGTPIPSFGDQMKGLGIAMATGGLMSGLNAHAQGNNFWTGKPNELGLIHNAQVSAINESQQTPMAAADDIDNVLMERVGNRTVGNYLNGKTNAITQYYPPNNGATTAGWKYDFLKPGDLIDRYGGPYGYFAGRPGDLPFMRSLPPDNSGAYNMYKVLKPIPIQESIIAPAFGQPGGGLQYLLPENIKFLEQNGYIINFKP